MINIPVYIKVEQKKVVTNKKIYIKDIADIKCNNKDMEKKIGDIILTTVDGKEDKKIIYSLMTVVELINKQYPEAQIINMGEKDFIIEYLSKTSSNMYFQYLKALVVALIAFLGSGFTIMTFNQDVSVDKLFDKINQMVLGTKDGHNVIEIAYSIGIGIGIVLFFNHFSRKKLEKELTPIQIEMRNYEQEMNYAFIEDASREGKMK